MTGVSFLIPARNAGPLLSLVVSSIAAQQALSLRPFEVVVVDDGSDDGAVEALRVRRPALPLQLIRTDGVGAAAALNCGLGVVRYPLVAQVDQDVRLEPGWLGPLLHAMDDPGVAAAQGQYVTDPNGTIWQRVMGRDLEDRYARLGAETGHVCTGNVVYRREALVAIGGFDERLGYGYDNDVSYRLRAAGFTLRYCATALSTHAWRPTLAGYVRQQYGFGYGRLDLVAKHRGHVRGDDVSRLPMMLHPLILTLALVLAAWSVLAGSVAAPMWSAAGLVSLLVVERAVAGLRALRRSGDPVTLLFPLAHLARDLAWVAAIVLWVCRRAGGIRPVPAHSMSPRRPRSAPRTDASPGVVEDAV
ncbi:MAG: glycosyltransferase [Vicinamibacterales bacterium]